MEKEKINIEVNFYKREKEKYKEKNIEEKIKSPDLSLELRYDFFNWVKIGIKNVEYRKYSSNIHFLRKGDVVEFLEVDKYGIRTRQKIYVEVINFFEIPEWKKLDILLHKKLKEYKNPYDLYVFWILFEVVEYYKTLINFLEIYYKDYIEKKSSIPAFSFKLINKKEKELI